MSCATLDATLDYLLAKKNQMSITPFQHVPHPHNPQLAETTLPKLKKEGLLFLLIDHRARPLFHSRLMHFVGYLLLPVGCAGEVQRQSPCNAGGAKAGW